jgi:hypothetical protein
MKTIRAASLFFILLLPSFGAEPDPKNKQAPAYKPAEPTSRMWSPEELERRKKEDLERRKKLQNMAEQAQKVEAGNPSPMWSPEELTRRKASQQQRIEEQKRANAEELEILSVQSFPGNVYYFPFVGHEFNRVLGNFMLKNQNEYEVSGMTQITEVKIIKFKDSYREEVSLPLEKVIGYTVALRLKPYMVPQTTMAAAK